ncbi:MAG: DNA repair protein [Clostridia bacterium]|nr:DNA repair protein [Clostridia bacterium]
MGKEKQRVYFVVDMKSFFASVECAERGLDAMTTKLVVADKSRTEGTICLAVTPALKELGVPNRCRLFEIPKGLDYIIAPPRMKKYIEYAAEIYGIYLKYIDKNDIHVYSIDECFIDVTDYLKIYNMRAKEFAEKLMKEILEKLGIPSSVGIGSNMYLAKIALDITAKHTQDRIGWLTEEKYKQTLWNHQPLTDFWQVSKGTVKRLAKYGIFDMEGIAMASENVLYKEFGINAELLIDHAWGRESCLMKDIKNYKRKSKSISSSQILPCNYNFDDAKLIMREMVQNGCYELFRQGYVTSHVLLNIGYGDSRGDFAKGGARMKETTNLYSIISGYTDKLYDEILDKNRPVRRVGYCFADLMGMEHEQYDFFVDIEKVEKEKKLVKSILTLQDKYGKNSILKGLDLEEKATQKERNETIGGHKSGEGEDVTG